MRRSKLKLMQSVIASDNERPKIRTHIGSETIEAMWELMRERCYPIENYPMVETPVRDAKDAYLLAMSEAIPAHILVTGDKDLLVLKQHGDTAIMNYQQFLLLLSGLHS